MSRSHFVPSLEACHKTRHMLHISVSPSHQLTEQYSVKPDIYLHTLWISSYFIHFSQSWPNALKNNATLSCSVGSQFFLVSTMEFAQFYAARFSSQNSLLASNKAWLLSSQWHHQKPTYGTHIMDRRNIDRRLPEAMMTLEEGDGSVILNILRTPGMPSTHYGLCGWWSFCPHYMWMSNKHNHFNL
jgi:hypothetical protein